MGDTRTLTGGCHCGLVRFETTLDLDNVIACNCSICSKKGLLLAVVPAERFALRAGDDQLAEYLFHKKMIHHRFCRVCGVEPFATGAAPDGSAVVAVNVRCLDEVDTAGLAVKPFDGRSLQRSRGSDASPQSRRHSRRNSSVDLTHSAFFASTSDDCAIRR